MAMKKKKQSNIYFIILYFANIFLLGKSAWKTKLSVQFQIQTLFLLGQNEIYLRYLI